MSHPIPIPIPSPIDVLFRRTTLIPVAVLYLTQPLKLDYLWAGLCLLGAVYFMFRGQSAALPG